MYDNGQPSQKKLKTQKAPNTMTDCSSGALRHTHASMHSSEVSGGGGKKYANMWTYNLDDHFYLQTLLLCTSVADNVLDQSFKKHEH